MNKMIIIMICVGLIAGPAYSMTIPSSSSEIRGHDPLLRSEAPATFGHIPNSGIAGGSDGWEEDEEYESWDEKWYNRLIIGLFYVGIIGAPDNLNDDDRSNDIYAYIALTPVALVLVAMAFSKS